MSDDTGKTALWACAAILSLLQAKRVVNDADLSALIAGLEAASSEASNGVSREALLTAQWLKQFIQPLAG